MIYITGDTHGEQSRFTEFIRHGAASWDENDILIVCGDFGYIFRDDVIEKRFLDDMATLKYTICFCDGNHENFDVINEFPCIAWNGGKAHKIRENVFHLMRGQVFTVQGNKIFTMGGAYSIDKYMRTEGYSWWKDELPGNEEYREADINLKKHNNRVDYVISHTAPREIIMRMGIYPDAHDAELTGFLEWIMYFVAYEKWFFGHWHLDKWIDEKHRAIYFDIEKIPPKGEN